MSEANGVGLVIETITSKRLNVSVEATDTIATLKQSIQRTEVRELPPTPSPSRHADHPFDSHWSLPSIPC